MESLTISPNNPPDLTTQMTKFSLTRSWAIENFSYYREDPTNFTSVKSPFFNAHEHGLKFKIAFYPNGTTPTIGERRFFSASVEVMSLSKSKIADNKSKSIWKSGSVVSIEYNITVVEVKSPTPFIYRKFFLKKIF